MAINKTYKSNSRNLTLFLTVKGRVRSLRFSDMGATYGYSIFITSDPNVQSALEHSKKFGTEFFLVNEEKHAKSAEEAQVTEQKPVDASYPKITRVQTAAQLLEEKYGIDPATISSKVDVLRHAKSLNIEFPNLK